MSEKQNFVIYNPVSLHHYKEYGIGIPMLNERVEKPFAYISKKYGVVATEADKFKTYNHEILSLAHDDEYCERVMKDPKSVVIDTYELIKEDGSFNRYNPEEATRPLEDFIDKALGHINGTIMACENALDLGFCYHLGGGMHHAMSFRPGGFCMFNDMVTAIRLMQEKGQIKNAVIIDMDAHKGDGTAQVTCDDSSIRTFSIHMRDGWPLDKEDKSDASFIHSDMDIGVTLEDDYLAMLKDGLEHFNPQEDFAIVVHGADVYEKDELESAQLIQLSKEDVLKRDLMVYELLKDRGIPQAWVMAGGYGRYVHEVFTQFLDHALEREMGARS
jgi:acetoin utilization deacetylase AcuC-like enzyme